MNKRRRSIQLLTAIASISLIAAACGGDDDDADTTDAPTESGPEGTTPEGTEGGGTAAAGGELIEGGSMVGDPLEHLDPALNSLLDGAQVTSALWDGLTDNDPETLEAKPDVAESFEANEDATVWTFTIKDGVTFSDGEVITPSTFQRSWERATDPDFAGEYAYLFNFIEGGREKLDGEAETITGVVADDEAMTLTVTLSAPYSNFPAVAGFQTFFPMPEGAFEDPAGYENTLMVSNGPYKMEAPRTDEEIVIVKNDAWKGDINGEMWPDRLERITFRTTADPDTAYNALEAGEADTALIPPARALEAQENWGTTLDVEVLGSYHWFFNQRDPRIGGPENLLLRQAISQAIDRETINEAVYNNTRVVSTGITPPGIPGFKENLCEFCTYDAEAAQAAFDEWTAAGNSIDEPLPIQFNAGAGHEDVAAIIVDNLAAIGIDSVSTPMPSEDYFSQLAAGACVICRAGWYADYPTYDNFMYDLFHQDSIGGNNHGYVSDEFDALVDQAKQTVDPDEQAALFNQAEDILLNKDIGVVPLNWYLGDQAYNQEKITNFPQTQLGIILWE
ncbi:MAG: ABC transporter substrate-binding protein, partial [Ilumatobacteraceae bacterium]